jgi:hypothetical protein
MGKLNCSAALMLGHAALLTLLAPSASAQVYDKSNPPPQPAWVGADGKVDLDKAPKEVSVAGPEGKPLMGPGGSEKKVPTHLGPPPPPLRSGGVLE